METNSETTSNSKNKISRIGWNILAVTTIVGLSALVIGLVTNNASAGDRADAGSKLDRLEKLASDSGEFRFKLQRPDRPDNSNLSAEDREIGKKGLAFFLGDDTEQSELVTCMKDVAEGTLGIDVTSEELEVNAVGNGEDIRMEISDGTKTVVVTDEQKVQLKEGMIDCLGITLEGTKKRFQADLESGL